MSIMAKTPSGYKKIGSAYLGERPVDKVFNANGDVVYALQRELTGVPPLLFKGKEQSELLNYRIYGDTVDGNSVGDLVESGEHAGEYKVDVTVEGKNLLHNAATSRIVNGVTFTVNSDESVTCNGTPNKDTAYLIKKINLYEANYILTGCPEGGTRSTYSIQYTNNVNSAKVDYGEGAFFTPYNSEQYPNIAVIVYIAAGYTCDNLTFYPMIRKADIEDDTYEPYHAPVTAPIYLPEPIKMVGDEAEYVDYAEQKQHRVRKNLLDENSLISPISGYTWYFDDEHYLLATNKSIDSREWSYDYSQFYIALSSGTYTLQLSGVAATIRYSGVYITKSNNEKIYSENIAGKSNITITFTLNTPDTIGIEIKIFDGKYRIMLNAGSTALPYEPYIENIDLDVTLPALPTLTGTNVLSVDTEVQPSRMDIKGRIKSLT